MNISQGNKISPDTIATLFESLATVSFAQNMHWGSITAPETFFAPDFKDIWWIFDGYLIDIRLISGEEWPS